jgi:transcriptional regulator with XRE-family HTH domain
MTPKGSTPESSAVQYVAGMSWRERLRASVDVSRRKHSLIAADAGVSPETLSRVLSGQHPRPSFETVVRIAHAVGENVGWILGEHGFALTAAQRRELRGFIAFLNAEILGAAPKLDSRAAPNAIRRRDADVPPPHRALGARLVYEARGDSMADAAIAEGDLLYVAPSADVRHAAGRIVVARLGAATFARQLEVRAGRTHLLSRSERYSPIDVDEESDRFELVGVVVARSGAPQV